MALDKQRIINELGSVMNQLKSADCGCMDKIFGNTAQTSAAPSFGGCRRGCCCGYGYGWNTNGSCGEPFPNKTQNNLYSPCMGRCNPPKLYADTYNYLTENLMQPTIKEVYSDLKSLTPANTVVNNPVANQMGFSKNGFLPQDNTGHTTNQFPMNNQLNMSNLNNGDAFNNNMNQQPNMAYMPVNEINSSGRSQMGGMGPQIMNLLGTNMSNPSNTTEQKQLSGPMIIDAPQSPHGQVGVTPLSAPMRSNHNAYNTNVQNYANNYNANQGMTESNFQPRENAQNTMNMNPAAQQMAGSHYSHGQHSQGVAKFNEMFPGVMKSLGGDLGFDPMAIAIQMNPANHQQAAINTMHKMMENNNINKVFDQSANAAALHTGVKPSNMAASNTQQNQIQNNVPPNKDQHLTPMHQTANESLHPNINPSSQITYQNNMNYKNNTDNKENIYGTSNVHANNQQTYQASLNAPVPNQQSYLQPDESQPQTSLQNQQQSIIDPNTGSIIAPPNFPAVYETDIEQRNITTDSPNTQQMIKEPIFPAETSRFAVPKQKYYEYNTLGQPIQMLSAKMYRTPEPALPQTLSPQQTNIPDTSRYSKVKSTVSKTSLMGSKLIGRTPSQLQQIYKQYKGSQSYTQQNIANPAVNNTTHSEGKLIATQNNVPQTKVPIEKIGGDTVVSNQIPIETTNKVEQVIGHIGDVPAANKPTNNGIPNKNVPIQNRKSRNGLQDIVYTSYPSSAAWSFHGVDAVPYTPGRRYRKH